jgi:hypothetical protein
MISGTKILVQPPYRGGFAQSHAEATARLAFFLTYFDEVVPIAFNPRAFVGKPLVLSTELEQRYVLSGHGRPAPLASPVNVEDLNDLNFLDDMATNLLAKLNQTVGGFALASREGFSASTTLSPADRLLLILEDCLPVPHHETPLEELLSFKKEHEAKLRAFHEAIDDLYYGFGTRPPDSLLPRLKDKLDAHVEQILKAYSQRGIRSYLGILKVGLKLASPAAGETIGLLAGVPIVGAILGGAISLCADKAILAIGGNAVPKDMEYIVSGLEAGHRRAFPKEQPMITDVVGPNLTNSILGTIYPPKVRPPDKGDFSGMRVRYSFQG